MSNIIKRFGKAFPCPAIAFGDGGTRLFICCRIGAPRCLFLLSDFAGQKTKVTQEFFENDEGGAGIKSDISDKSP